MWVVFEVDDMVIFRLVDVYDEVLIVVVGGIEINNVSKLMELY